MTRTSETTAGDADAGEEPEPALAVDDPVAMYRAKAEIKAGLFSRARRASKVPRIERFTVAQMIGRGGFGTVFRAHDPTLGRDVAIKVVLLEGEAGDDEATLQEARTMARLRHPSIVHVYDVGICDATSFLGPDASRCLYIVMELLEGRSLRAWMGERSHSVDEIFGVFLQVGRGLVAAHQRDVVHLDLKPSNIHVDGNCVTVLDFGLSRVIEPDTTAKVDEGPEVTRVFGTPEYMAPEQHRGLRPGPAADQFALAVCIYEALLEQRPFVGSSVEQLAQAKLAGPPVIPARPGLDRRRRRALRRALAPAPEDRFPSMLAFVEALAPRRTGRVAGLAAAAAVGVMATTWFGSNAGASRCSDIEARARQLWGQTVASRIEAGFGALTVEYSEQAQRRVRERLEQRSREWALARRDACLARSPDESRPSARIHCLERYFDQANAVVEVLVEPDLVTLRNLDRVLGGLDGLERCEREQQLPPPPAWLIEDASTGLEIHGRIARAHALVSAGRDEEAQALIEAAMADAREIDAFELEAEAAAVRCQASGPLNARLRAKEACARALVASERAQRPDLSFRVLLHQVALLDKLELGAMAHAVELAEAKRLLLGPDPVLDARLSWSRSNVDVNHGRYEQALAAQREAREVFLEEYGAGSSSDIAISNSIAILLMSMGRLEDAREELRRLLPLLRGTDGPGQPREAVILNNLGRACLLSGDPVCAKDALESALEIKERHFGARSEAVLSTRFNLAHVLDALDDRSGALEMIERTIAIARRHPGRPGDLAVFEALALGLSRDPGDRGPCEELAESFERLKGEMNDHSLVAVGLHTGRCFIDAGSPDSAQSVFEALMDFHGRWTMESLELHEVQRGLAWCAHQRGDVDRARTWLEQAASQPHALPEDQRLVRALLEALEGEPSAARSERARRWLER